MLLLVLISEVAIRMPRWSSDVVPRVAMRPAADLGVATVRQGIAQIGVEAECLFCPRRIVDRPLLPLQSRRTPAGVARAACKRTLLLRCPHTTRNGSHRDRLLIDRPK